MDITTNWPKLLDLVIREHISVNSHSKLSIIRSWLINYTQSAIQTLKLNKERGNQSLSESGKGFNESFVVLIRVINFPYKIAKFQKNLS